MECTSHSLSGRGVHIFTLISTFRTFICFVPCDASLSTLSYQMPFSRFARAWALAGLLCLTAISVHAQTTTIRGFVNDASDGQPIPGVNVTLVASDGALFGSATNTDGFYAVSRVPVGTYTFRVTFIGYETFEDTIALEEDVIITRNVDLAVSSTELDEVVVEVERETAGAANVTAGLQTVRPADIALVPSPDISADLVNYLTALPGIVSQGDRGGQLFIRGGEPTQNLVLLDGMILFQPFHVVGFFSAFPSDIINTADVYAGGYGSEFGGRLSSVMDITTRTGNKRRFVGAASVAPFVSTLRLEGPLVPGKVSFVASIRESVIEQGAEQIINEPLPFSFGDLFGKIHASLGPSAQLSITGITTDDTGRLGLNPLNEDVVGITQDEVNYSNTAVGGRLFFLPSSLPLFAEITGSVSKFDNEFGPQGNPDRTTSVDMTSFAADITYFVGTTDVNWGLFLTSSTLESDLGGLFQNVDKSSENLTEVGAYLEPEFTFGNGLRVQPGLRLQSFPSLGESYLEPRLRVVWNTGMHRFSLAGGVYHQQVTGLNDRRDAGDIFTAWTAAPRGTVPTAQHAILGYRIAPVSGLAFSAEGFYKNLTDLLVPEWTAFPRFTTNLEDADGTAKGFDLRTEVGNGRVFQGSLSYAWSEVAYESTSRGLQILTGDNAVEYTPPHDRTHQINAMGALTIKDFHLNVRWQFGSGLPFNESLGFDRFILLDSLVNVLEEPGDERVLFNRPYTGRLPTYHRIDVSLDREFRVGPTSFLTFQAGLINAYDRRNLFFLDLFTLRRVDQLPVIPTVGLKFEVK